VTDLRMAVAYEEHPRLGQIPRVGWMLYGAVAILTGTYLLLGWPGDLIVTGLYAIVAANMDALDARLVSILQAVQESR
jgi:hypothetical protein